MPQVCPSHTPRNAWKGSRSCLPRIPPRVEGIKCIPPTDFHADGRSEAKAYSELGNGLEEVRRSFVPMIISVLVGRPAGLTRAGLPGYACGIMKSSPSASMATSWNGCAFALISLLLGLVFTLGTVLYQGDRDSANCGGALSAGFPLAFVCDDSAGSPISSWGKIDLADIVNINPRALLLDLLLISALLTLAWTVITGLRKGLAQDETFRWAMVLCTGYILAFLFFFLMFQAHTLNFAPPRPTTPTPIIYTPTPFGTPTFPDLPPTSGP